MKKVDISSLNPAKFIKLVPSRDQIIASNPANPIPHQDTYAANKIAKALHPDKQFVKIAKVEAFSPDVKRYTFVPDRCSC